MKSSVSTRLSWSVSVIAALVLAGLAERAWMTYRARAALRHEERTLRTLLASQPLPTHAVAAELESRLAAATSALREARSATARNREALTEIAGLAVPGSTADAFFDLARFQNRMRTRAQQCGVELTSEEPFGFGAYDHGGPPARAIAGMFRQRVLAERLLETLFAAAPHQLVLFERDPVAGEAVKERITAAESVPETVRFRVGFVGETTTLRSWLNALAAAEVPWVVRSVAAEPAAANQAAMSDDLTGGGTLVRRARSRFVVEVTCASLPPLLPIATEMAGAPLPSAVPATEPTARWEAPMAQARGDEWAYEIFTPPEIRLDPISGRLVVVRSADVLPEQARVLATETDFRLTLKRVEPLPFRLQLVGFAGARESPRGVFEKVATGEILLLGPRSPIASLDLTVEAICVGPRVEGEPQETSHARPVAAATVQDERTGKRVTLTTEGRALTDELRAVVESSAAGGARHSVRTGDLIREGAVVYRVDKIQLAPAAVSVTKLGPGDAALEKRTLVLQPELLAEQSSGSL